MNFIFDQSELKIKRTVSLPNPSATIPIKSKLKANCKPFNYKSNQNLNVANP